MKISEMTNDQASEAMIRLSTPISNIFDDDEAHALIDKFSNMSDMNVLDAIGKYLPQVITYAFRKHRADLYEIVGALTMKTPEAVAKMNFKETIQTVKDSWDDVLKSFFPSSSRSKKESGGS